MTHILFSMNKLVRDKIPEIIKQDGKTPKIHVANEKEYKDKLFKKLLEECLEFIESESIEELADISEVLQAIYKQKSIAPKAVDKLRILKKKKRGGFNKRIILDSIN